MQSVLARIPKAWKDRKKMTAEALNAAEIAAWFRKPVTSAVLSAICGHLAPTCPTS
jgi:hypothetical protein